MKSKITQPLFEDLLPGLHKAVFMGREGPQEGKYGEFIIWRFAIQVDDQAQDYTGISSTNFVATSKCKGYRWAQALDPTLTPETKEWEDVKFIGTEVTLSLVDQDDPPSGWLKVDEVFALTP